MKTAVNIIRGLFGVLLFVAMTAPFSAALDTPNAEDCLPTYPPPPTVKIKVRVPACNEPGGAITYRICVENCSTAEAHHVTVKDALPSNAKFVKSDPPPSKVGPELIWNLGTVGGGAVREIILVLLPTNKEDVKNCARVTFEHGQCVVTRQTFAAPLGGGRPPIISTVPSDPTTKEPPIKGDDNVPILDLQVRGPKEQYANLASDYHIVVTNKGKTKATKLQINARVPDKLKIVKASEPGVALDNEVAWNLGDLEPGMSRTVELTLRATERGEYCLKVFAEADRVSRKEVEFCTKFHGMSALSIEMHDSDDPVFIGQKTSYPITVRSMGGTPVTNLRVIAFIPPELKLDRANAAYDELPLKEGRPGRWIEFKTLPKIEADSHVKYEVYVEAVQAGVTYFQIEVMADQLDAGRPVIEQELTTVADDREKVNIKKLSRMKPVN
jgi:uncharacterized repeat protein (TIGR01451 family)